VGREWAPLSTDRREGSTARVRTGALRALLLGGAVVWLSAGSALAQAAPTSAGPVVGIRDGSLLGTSSRGVDEFLGIPYAKRPVKNLRFRPPKPPAPWRGMRDATDLPPACLQFQPTGAREGQAVSEDCLYLDLYRPSDARPGQKLPVQGKRRTWWRAAAIVTAIAMMPASAVALGGAAGAHLRARAFLSSGTGASRRSAASTAPPIPTSAGSGRTAAGS
jgi:Carboxylesterase family